MSPFCNHFGLFCQNFSHFWLKFFLLLLHYWDFFAKLGRQLWRGSQPRRYTFRPSRHFCFNLFFLCFQFFNHFISERNTFEKLLIFWPKKGQFSRKLASKQQQHSSLQKQNTIFGLFSHFFSLKHTSFGARCMEQTEILKCFAAFWRRNRASMQAGLCALFSKNSHGPSWEARTVCLAGDFVAERFRENGF